VIELGFNALSTVIKNEDLEIAQLLLNYGANSR
jgi:hypothetical protein